MIQCAVPLLPPPACDCMTSHPYEWVPVSRVLTRAKTLHKKHYARNTLPVGDMVRQIGKKKRYLTDQNPRSMGVALRAA
jgi:hypothetical protein